MPVAATAISSHCVAIIKEFEGFRSKAYLDAAGVATIGYGSTTWYGQPVLLGMTITEPQAEQQLTQDCGNFVRGILRLTYVDLTQNQLDALTSFCYNLGISAYESSTLRRTINSRGTVVQDMFTRWNKVKDPRTGQYIVLAGLTRRRELEYHLYVTPDPPEQ